MKKRLTLFEVLGERFSTLDEACQHVYEEAGFDGDWLAGMSELADGRYTAVKGNPKLPHAFSLQDRMPPVYDQASRGTCVANAVAALMEYYEDTGTRLSVQYLFEYMKRDERACFRKAATELANGQVISDPDIRVEAERIRMRLYAAARAQAQEGEERLSTVVPTDEQLAGVLYARAVERSGSNLRYPFRVLRDHGICTYDVWPYDRRQLESLSRLDDANVQHLPPGADADAFRHRLNEQVYLFASPNNVEEIRNYIGGLCYAPMPVCIGAVVFTGPDGKSAPLEDGVLRIPKFTSVEIVQADYDCEVDVIRHTFSNPICVEGSRMVAKTVKVPDLKVAGGHAMVLVGFCDDETMPGGGYFIVRNSWGGTWGENGYAKMPYAYVEMFVDEAATILRPKTEDAVPPSPVVDKNADLEPYLVVAVRDMKDRRGCYRIKKGQKVLVDDEGRADVYSELNARIFRKNGYVWKV